MRASAARHGSFVFAGACAALIGSAAVSRARPDPRPAAIGDEILALVRDNFVDGRRARDWAKQHRGYGAATPGWAAFAARTNQILAELGTSHTASYPRGGREQPMLSAISLLYLAVAKVLVDGQRLEGTGVAPGIEVHDDLEYAQGKDPQLERAVAVAAAEAKNRESGRRRPGSQGLPSP